ncbi:MAG: DUF1223 domain-containing protein [Alphaproteobacteria bacterium]|nr:DUF1223 domain-containing protein [Alphaproteobacteria bacterium]
MFMLHPMQWRRIMMAAALLAALAWDACAPARAQERPVHRTGAPIVVELFTAQSCDLCARANRTLSQYARDGDVIALTFPVDYWDYLGWRDTFAQNAFTRRQRTYRRSFGGRGLATPEIVVNGMRHAHATRADEIDTMLTEINRAPLRPGPSITITPRNRRADIIVGRGAAPSEPADVWIVAFDPGPVWETIGGGVNRGQRMPHYNLVRELRRAGSWSGAPARFDQVYCPRDCAVLVQAARGGPILAAARTPIRE